MKHIESNRKTRWMRRLSAWLVIAMLTAMLPAALAETLEDDVEESIEIEAPIEKSMPEEAPETESEPEQESESAAEEETEVVSDDSESEPVEEVEDFELGDPDVIVEEREYQPAPEGAIVITGFEPLDVDGFMLAQKPELETVLQRLPETVFARFEGREEPVELKGAWTCPDYDERAYGTFTFTFGFPEETVLIGDVEVPVEQMFLADEVEMPSIDLVVATIESFEELPYKHIVLAEKPESVEALRETLQLPETVMGRFQNEETSREFPVEWELTLQDDETATYTFCAAFAGTQYLLADGVKMPEVTASMVTSIIAMETLAQSEYTLPEMPETPEAAVEAMELPATLDGLIEGAEDFATFDVVWKSADFGVENAEAATFTAELAGDIDGYVLEEGVEMPSVVLVAKSDNPVYEGFEYTLNDKGIATIVHCTDEVNQNPLIIPAEIIVDEETVYKVSAVGNGKSLFDLDEDGESVATFDELIISDGIESVASNAFAGCEAVSSVTFPDSLQSMSKNTVPVSEDTEVTLSVSQETTLDSIKSFRTKDSRATITLPKAIDNITIRENGHLTLKTDIEVGETEKSDKNKVIQALTLESGSSLTVDSQKILTNNDGITVDTDSVLTVAAGAMLNNFAELQNYGSIMNEGTIINYETIENNGDITNKGLLTNYADDEDDVDEDENIYSGSFTNNGTLNNAGQIVNMSDFSNDGEITNDKDSMIENTSGEFTNNTKILNNGIIENIGETFTNDGTITNNGTIVNGATFENSGTIDGEDGFIYGCQPIEGGEIKGNTVQSGHIIGSDGVCVTCRKLRIELKSGYDVKLTKEYDCTTNVNYEKPDNAKNVPEDVEDGELTTDDFQVNWLDREAPKADDDESGDETEDDPKYQDLSEVFGDDIEIVSQAYARADVNPTTTDSGKTVTSKDTSNNSTTNIITVNFSYAVSEGEDSESDKDDNKIEFTLELPGKITPRYIGDGKEIADDFEIDDIDEQKYKGKAVTPDIDLVYTYETTNKDGKTVQEEYKLKNKTDYTLSYSNNKKAGATAKVTVQGVGNFTGKFVAEFDIEENDSDGGYDDDDDDEDEEEESYYAFSLIRNGTEQYVYINTEEKTVEFYHEGARLYLFGRYTGTLKDGMGILFSSYGLSGSIKRTSKDAITFRLSSPSRPGVDRTMNATDEEAVDTLLEDYRYDDLGILMLDDANEGIVLFGRDARPRAFTMEDEDLYEDDDSYEDVEDEPDDFDSFDEVVDDEVEDEPSGPMRLLIRPDPMEDDAGETVYLDEEESRERFETVHLRLTNDQIGKLKHSGYVELVYALENAELRIPLDALTSEIEIEDEEGDSHYQSVDMYDICIEQANEDQLTEAETAALDGMEPLVPMYRVEVNAVKGDIPAPESVIRVIEEDKEEEPEDDDEPDEGDEEPDDEASEGEETDEDDLDATPDAEFIVKRLGYIDGIELTTTAPETEEEPEEEAEDETEAEEETGEADEDEAEEESEDEPKDEEATEVEDEEVEDEEVEDEEAVEAEVEEDEAEDEDETEEAVDDAPADAEGLVARIEFKVKPGVEGARDGSPMMGCVELFEDEDAADDRDSALNDYDDTLFSQGHFATGIFVIRTPSALTDDQREALGKAIAKALTAEDPDSVKYTADPTVPGVYSRLRALSGADDDKDEAPKGDAMLRITPIEMYDELPDEARTLFVSGQTGEADSTEPWAIMEDESLEYIGFRPAESGLFTVVAPSDGLDEEEDEDFDETEDEDFEELDDEEEDLDDEDFEESEDEDLEEADEDFADEESEDEDFSDIEEDVEEEPEEEDAADDERDPDDFYAYRRRSKDGNMYWLFDIDAGTVEFYREDTDTYLTGDIEGSLLGGMMATLSDDTTGEIKLKFPQTYKFAVTELDGAELLMEQTDVDEVTAIMDEIRDAA